MLLMCVCFLLTGIVQAQHASTGTGIGGGTGTGESQGTYIYAVVDETNLEDVTNEIHRLFEIYYESGVTRERIENYLRNYIMANPIDSACAPPTKLTCTSCITTTNFMTGETLLLRWIEEEEDIEGEGEGESIADALYFGSYLDIKTDSVVQDTNLVGGVILPEVNYDFHKLLAFSRFCSDTQLPYVIIIIDKDITLAEVLEGVNEGSVTFRNEPMIRTSEKSVTGFLIAPNPTTDQINIEFNLTQEAKISLQIFEIASGRMVKEVYSEGSRSAGEHRRSVDLSDLSAGLYYAVLQTPQKQYTQKIVRMN